VTFKHKGREYETVKSKTKNGERMCERCCASKDFTLCTALVATGACVKDTSLVWKMKT